MNSVLSVLTELTGADASAASDAAALDAALRRFARIAAAAVSAPMCLIELRARGTDHRAGFGFPAGPLPAREDLPEVAASVPLADAEGQPTGLLTVFDTARRRWSDAERAVLEDVAASAQNEVDHLHRAQSCARAEARLRAAELGFRTVAHEMGEGLVFTDLDDVVLYANPRFCEIYGYRSDEMIGRITGELLLPPDEQSSLRRRLVDRARGIEERYRMRNARQDGSDVWVEVRALPLRTPDGRVVGTIGIVTDVTENEQSEWKLFAAESRYRRLFTSSPYAIFALDAHGRFTAVNPAFAAILGHPFRELIGRSLMEFTVPDDRRLLLAEIQATLSGAHGRPETELRVTSANGQSTTLRTSFTPIREADDGTGVHGVARDLTEEHEREGQLRRAERLASVGTLVGGVAHELNNPLTSIKSFAQLLLLDERSTEDREALEIVEREADRAAKIVADLRLFARQTQEGTAPDPADEVDLNEVVRHVLKLRRYALETHNVAVHESFGEALSAVRAGRGEIEQVVLNLIVNAEQAMREAPGERLLSIRTTGTGHTVQLRIGDTGPGIAEENLERIFDPFWTTKSPGEGTGLGLSMVHAIVAENGGAIQVDSVPGGGATFVVSLPVAALDVIRSVAKAPTLATRALRILVIDDEASSRDSLARYLERRGHSVDLAGDGAAALERLYPAEAAPQYDVVLADLRMPGIGGDELLRELRARGDRLERRLVFFTGDAASADASRFLTTAGIPFVLKPFELDRLAMLIEEHAETIRDDRVE